MTESRSGAFDWEAAKRRLAQGALHGQTAEELDEVFRDRAIALARRPEQGPQARLTLHLAFRVANVSFACEAASVRRCLAPSWVTRVPCAPPHLSDVIHVDGRIVSVADLAVIFGLASTSRGPGIKRRVIMVESRGKTLGVWADRLAGILPLDEHALDSARGQGGRGGEFLRGISADMTLVLDAAELVTRVKSLGGASC